MVKRKEAESGTAIVHPSKRVREYRLMEKIADYKKEEWEAGLGVAISVILFFVGLVLWKITRIGFHDWMFGEYQPYLREAKLCWYCSGIIFLIACGAGIYFEWKRKKLKKELEELLEESEEA